MGRWTRQLDDTSTLLGSPADVRQSREYTNGLTHRAGALRSFTTTLAYTSHTHTSHTQMHEFVRVLLPRCMRQIVWGHPTDFRSP